MTASRFSFAPLGEPGSVITSDLFLVPATGRAIMATVYVSWSFSISGEPAHVQGVTFNDEAIIPCLSIISIKQT